MTPTAREIRHLRRLVHRLRDEQLAAELTEAKFLAGFAWQDKDEDAFRVAYLRETRRMMKVPTEEAGGAK